MVKCKKRGVSKKKKHDQLDFLFLLLILPSAHLPVNETPSDLRGRSCVSHLQFLLSFSYSCYRLTSASSNLILRELKMYFQYRSMHCMCVCKVQKKCADVYACICQGVALTGETPLTSLPFVQSLGDSHHQKSMCVRAYVRLCVCVKVL